MLGDHVVFDGLALCRREGAIVWLVVGERVAEVGQGQVNHRGLGDAFDARHATERFTRDAVLGVLISEQEQEFVGDVGLVHASAIYIFYILRQVFCPSSVGFFSSRHLCDVQLALAAWRCHMTATLDSSALTPWPAPFEGDMLWCNFPQFPSLDPGPKPRPVLVLQVRTFPNEGLMLLLVPGTTQGLHKIYPGEALILHSDRPAFEHAGLAFDTKFQFGESVVLPWTHDYFKVPQHRPFGDTPKIGTLHPTMVRSFSAAYAAYKDRLSWL